MSLFGVGNRALRRLRKVSSDQSLLYYATTLALATEPLDAVRGYRFEHIVREMLPWDKRPPVSVRSTSEQLDALFLLNGRYFIVEAKAKREPITEGSADWEDFELKLARRKGRVSGLFLSIFPVSDNIFARSLELSRDGSPTIVVAGNMWKDLLQYQVSLSSFIEYHLLRTTILLTRQLPSVKEAAKWLYNAETSTKVLTRQMESLSAVFLRRHKSPYHAQIYVNRRLDERIGEQLQLLLPNALSRRTRRKKTDTGGSVTVRRVVPAQIIIVRDKSGAGKTTLAINIALSEGNFIPVARAAAESNIDLSLDHLRHLGDDWGLQHFIAAQKTALLVIDSLDEASHLPNKRKEVLSLNRLIKELNECAARVGLIGFPVLLVYTIRDDYWRDWESVFEGAGALVWRNLYGMFTDDEFQIALDKYSKSYRYEVAGRLSSEQRNLLRDPFNLLVFSEAMEHRGAIGANDVLADNVIELYFSRKRDDVYRRPIPGLSPDLLISLLAKLAYVAGTRGINTVNRQDIADAGKSNGIMPSHLDAIMHFIVSERVLTLDVADGTLYRFRHVRFIEYLCAHYIVGEVDRSGNNIILNISCQELGQSNSVSILAIHNLIRKIAIKKSPALYESIVDFYSNSSTALVTIVEGSRHRLAMGQQSSELDLDTIERAVSSDDPNICWDCMFVVASKANKQPREKVIAIFTRAWRSPNHLHERWRLLERLARSGLLMEEEVVEKMFSTANGKEWLVFLECVIDYGHVEEFKECWEHYGGDKWLKRKNIRMDSDDWVRFSNIMPEIRHKGYYERGI
jgi:hypothetical protein